MMDERNIAILKTVALEVLNADDGDVKCAFDCGGDHNGTTERIDIIAHKETCETIIARDLLREQGILLYSYVVRFDQKITKKHMRSPGWHTIRQSHKAFSEQEVIDAYPESKEVENGAIIHCRNLKIEYIGEL